MLRLGWAVPCVAFFFCLPCVAEFSIEEKDRKLQVSEYGRPVLVYNYGRVVPPPGIDQERYWRSSYIHPLYGLDGNVLTDDFPADHLHHRGVFWTWPETRIGDREMDVWTIVGARQLFQRWLAKEVTDEYVRIGVENGWFFDGESDPKVTEQVFFTVHPAQDDHRAIDFDLRFTNVTDEEVTFLGAIDKGYGGFLFRPDADNKPFQFVTKKGTLNKDALRFETPWASIGWNENGTRNAAGVAVFQHPSNPDYPHDGWIFRHYGLLGASWPHEQRHLLKPGESFALKYRFVIHRGTDTHKTISRLFAEYMKSVEQGKSSP